MVAKEFKSNSNHTVPYHLHVTGRDLLLVYLLATNKAAGHSARPPKFNNGLKNIYGNLCVTLQSHGEI